MTIEYNMLKSNIIKACKQVEKGEIKFIVNYDKLNSFVDDFGLEMVNIGTKSKQLEASDVPLISEYFKGRKLSWLNDNKYYTTLVFVLSESIDKKCESLLKAMNTPCVEDPDIDKVNALATIIAEYPCYFATVISYMSNDPVRFGKPSYEIKCRANTVAIKREDYKYNQDDMV